MPSSRNAIISLLVPNGSSEDTIFESYGTNRFTCAYCEASPMDNKTELLCCSSCARVWYCNELHLLKDWRAHQLFCRTVLSASRSDKPRGTRSILTSTSSVTDDSNFFEEEIPVEPLSHPISRLDKARARANRCINHNKNDDQLVRCDEVKITCAVSATTEKEAEEKKNDDNTVTSTVIDRLVSKLRNTGTSGNESKFDHSDNISLDLQQDKFTLRAKQLPKTAAGVFITRRVAYFITESLVKYGWAVIDSLLGDKESSEVRLEVERLYADGTFVNGTTAKSLPSETVRGDKVQWWSSDQNSGPVGNLITQLDLIMAEVSKLLNDKKEKSIMGKTKAMISCFPAAGSQYLMHVDNPNEDGKLITSVYHSNAHWSESCGGQLKLYPITADKPILISPILDRLVLFWSDRRVPYEIEPSNVQRFSITIWYLSTSPNSADKKAANVSNKSPLKEILSPQTSSKRSRMDSSEKPLKPVKAVLPKKIYNRQQPVSDTNDNCEEPVLRACRKCRDHACHATVRYNRKYNRAKEKLAKQQQQSKAKEVMKPKELTKVCSDSSADMNLSSKAKEDHSAEKQSQLEATLLAQMSTIHQPPTHAHPQQQLPEDLLERRQKFYQHCQSLKSSPNPYQQQMLESLAKEMFERKRQLAAAAVMTSAAADKHDNVSFDPNLQLQLARFIQKSSEVCPSKLYGRQSQSFSMPTNRIPTVPQISPSVAGGSDQLKSFAKYFEMLKQSHTPVDYQFYLPNSPAAPSVIDHRPSVIRNFPFGPIFSPSQHSYNPAFIAGESQQGGIREPNAAGAGSLKLPTYHPS